MKSHLLLFCSVFLVAKSAVAFLAKLLGEVVELILIRCCVIWFRCPYPIIKAQPHHWLPEQGLSFPPKHLQTVISRVV